MAADMPGHRRRPLCDERMVAALALPPYVAAWRRLSRRMYGRRTWPHGGASRGSTAWRAPRLGGHVGVGTRQLRGGGHFGDGGRTGAANEEGVPAPDSSLTEMDGTGHA
jgi:hypothetical protein